MLSGYYAIIITKSHLTVRLNTQSVNRKLHRILYAHFRFTRASHVVNKASADCAVRIMKPLDILSGELIYYPLLLNTFMNSRKVIK